MDGLVAVGRYNFLSFSSSQYPVSEAIRSRGEGKFIDVRRMLSMQDVLVKYGPCTMNVFGTSMPCMRNQLTLMLNAKTVSTGTTWPPSFWYC